MADGKGKSILEQLLEEAAEHGKAAAQADDFAVNLTTTDSDGGTHSIQGIPMSRVGPDFLARFGITGPGEGEGQGEGDKGGQGEGQGDKPTNPVVRYFTGGKPASGKQQAS